MSVNSHNKQTEKYYVLREQYYKQLTTLKQQQASILAPFHKAIWYEIQMHKLTFCMIYLILYSLIYVLTLPIGNWSLYTRIISCFVLSVIIAGIIFAITAYTQIDIYKQNERKNIQNVKKMYRKLNQQYNKMYKEQLLHANFQINSTEQKNKD